MKNKIIKTLLVIIIAASLISLCACGGWHKGRETKALQLFHGGLFILPVESQMRTYDGPMSRMFDSLITNKDLSELFELLSSVKNPNVTYTLYGDYIYIEAKATDCTSGAILKYDGNYSNKKNLYLYSFCNLSSVLEGSDTQLPIMTPDHLMEDFSKVENLSVSYIIYCDRSYQARGSIEEFEAFYVKNGYSVERTDNTLNVTDTSIDHINENAIYCDIPEEISFKITFENGYVKYTV